MNILKLKENKEDNLWIIMIKLSFMMKDHHLNLIIVWICSTLNNNSNSYNNLESRVSTLEKKVQNLENKLQKLENNLYPKAVDYTEMSSDYINASYQNSMNIM